VPLALSTEHSIALGLVAAAFVVFALVSSLVIPRRWPQFPGERGLRWFVVVTVLLCIGTLAAVEVFAKEGSEETAQAETQTQTETTATTPGTTGTTPGTTTSATQPPAAPQGDPAAGKAVFAAQGCGSCHAYGPAGASGTVGPDLDEALQGKDPAFIHESIVAPDKEIAPGYQPNIMPSNFEQTLTPKQIDDLVSFLSEPS
jgi:mono/diheme cytochrome c family protein